MGDGWPMVTMVTMVPVLVRNWISASYIALPRVTLVPWNETLWYTWKHRQFCLNHPSQSMDMMWKASHVQMTWIWLVPTFLRKAECTAEVQSYSQAWTMLPQFLLWYLWKLLRRANRNLREKAALVPDASASIWTEHHLVCVNLRSGLKQISSTRNICCLPRLKTRLRDLLLRRLSSSALAMDLDPGPGWCAMPRNSTEILLWLSVVVAGMARWRSFALQEAERVQG